MAALRAGECDWIISRWSGNKSRTHECKTQSYCFFSAFVLREFCLLLLRFSGIDSLLAQGYSVATDTSLGLADDNAWLGKFVQLAQMANNGVIVCCTRSQAQANHYVEMEIRHANDAKDGCVYICFPGGQIQPY